MKSIFVVICLVAVGKISAGKFALSLWLDNYNFLMMVIAC